jgi:hypothetical protein
MTRIAVSGGRARSGHQAHIALLTRVWTWYDEITSTKWFGAHNQRRVVFRILLLLARHLNEQHLILL